MRSTLSGQSILVLTAVCLSSSMVGLEISSVPIILSTLEKVLRADFRQLQWTINAYTIAASTVMMATGVLADRYGRKRIFVTAIIAFGVASLICGLAPNMPVLILGRAFQGASGGAMLICQIAILSQRFQDAGERAKVFGWWGIIFGFGLGFGPIIGGGIAAMLGWRWVFLIHACGAIVAACVAMSSVQESKSRETEHLDVVGILSLSLAVFCLVFFITQGSELGFGSPTTLAVLVTAVVGLIVFIIAERSVAYPMFDFSVFKVRRFTGALLGSIGMNFCFWPFMMYLPIWFQAGIGFKGFSANAALLAYTLPTLVVPPFAERLALRRGTGFVIPVGLTTIGLGFLVMMIAVITGPAAWLTTLIGALVAGVGLGATNTPVTNTLTGAVSSDRAGMASGIDMSARLISLALNIALMGFILTGGVLQHLKNALGLSMGTLHLGSLAAQIAAGNIVIPLDGSGLTSETAHAALTQGFIWVMLYGAICILALAILSFVLLRQDIEIDSHAAPSELK
jgi:EmrB/QacA subfamily drug resistance transporter